MRVKKINSIKEKLQKRSKIHRAAIIRWNKCVWRNLLSVSHNPPKINRKNKHKLRISFGLQEAWAVSRPQKVAAGQSCTDSVHMFILTHLDIFSTESNWADWRPATTPLDMFSPGDRLLDYWLPEMDAAGQVCTLLVFFVVVFFVIFSFTSLQRQTQALNLGFYGTWFEWLSQKCF